MILGALTDLITRRRTTRIYEYFRIVRRHFLIDCTFVVWLLRLHCILIGSGGTSVGRARKVSPTYIYRARGVRIYFAALLFSVLRTFGSLFFFGIPSSWIATFSPLCYHILRSSAELPPIYSLFSIRPVRFSLRPRVSAYVFPGCKRMHCVHHLHAQYIARVLFTRSLFT